MKKSERQQIKLHKAAERAAREREIDDLAIRTLKSSVNKNLRDAAEHRIMRRLKK